MAATSFSPLLRDDELTIGRFDCHGADAAAPETASFDELVFVHRGAYRLESSRGSVLADRGQVLLLRCGEEYRVRHPLGGGDQSLVVTLRAGLFERLCEQLVPGRDPDRAPARLARPAAHSFYWSSRRLRAALERAGGDDEALREEARALVAGAIACFVADGEPPRRPARPDAAVLAVQTLLHSDRGRRASLERLAAQVGLSPFVLARRFRRTLGESIHQYRLALRLREALERLAAGESDLTALALDLGFADHAHFTNAFRRRFGLPPSAARAELAPPRSTPPH